MLPIKTLTLIFRSFKNFLLLAFSIYFFYLLFHSPNCISPLFQSRGTSTYPYPTSQTTLSHIVFGIASSARSFPKRKEYLRLWWNPNRTRGYVWLDRAPNVSDTDTNSHLYPPWRVSEPTSSFPYSFKGGLSSAVRVSRIVSESVRLNLTDVRWYVLGDDDTVFFTENLVRVLSKYDHEQWFYIGAGSESVEQNALYSFDMAFGGGGFAISYKLARVLARVQDSCLMRYSDLYGSDARVFSCLAELGVGLTHESGFHQVDIRGDLFGILSAHPLAPLISLHHLDTVEPIFPKLTRTQALERLFEAVKVDPGRIVQQTVCYDRSKAWTISVSWGYAVQVFESIQLLPNLLSLPKTFMPWRRGRISVSSTPYMFKTREIPKDPCKRPAILLLENVLADANGIWSNYSRYQAVNCHLGSAKNLEQIRVFSRKLDFDLKQLQAPRRHCCDVLPSSSDKIMNIGIRYCKHEELIFMQPR